MPNRDTVIPTTAAPVNRLTLGVDSVRLNGGDLVDPSSHPGQHEGWYCFAGADE